MKKLVILSMLLVLGLAACEQATVVTPTATLPAAPAASPTSARPLTAVPAVPERATATAARPPRTEIVATDPTTVNLASGQVQLVEFFAFW